MEGFILRGEGVLSPHPSGSADGEGDGETRSPAYASEDLPILHTPGPREVRTERLAECVIIFFPFYFF